MGVRGEIFSSKVILPNRTYFFNVKENRMGDLYLNIVESKNRETGGFDRQSVILFADDLQEFLKGFDESLRIMEKAVREKRRSGVEKSGRDEKHDDHHGDLPPRRRIERTGYGERTGRVERAERGEKNSYRRTGPGEKSSRGEKDGYRRAGEKTNRGEKNRKNDRGFDRGSERSRPERGYKGGKRVVVKRQDR